MSVPMIVTLAVLALVVLWALLSYNRLVQLRNRIEAAWSQIDVQLKRRHDLVPNLVETVKGYATHEQETLERVVQARNQAITAGGSGGAAGQAQAQAENGLTQALRQIFALAEAYPDLKANQSFLALQEELTGTEGRIAYARQFYNEQVLQYDNALSQIPSSLIGRLGGFQPKPYFEVEDAARDAVRVDFGSRPAGS